MTTDLYSIQVAAGPLVLDTEVLVGVVVDDTYEFSATHEVLDDIDDFEVSGGGYARLSATARVELDGDRWVVWLDGVTTADLSAVADRGGVVWVRPNDDLISFTADVGGAVNPYEPTWPSGLFDYPVDGIDDVLTDLEDRVAALEDADLAAAAPITLVDGEVALSFGAGLALEGGNLVAEAGPPPLSEPFGTLGADAYVDGDRCWFGGIAVLPDHGASNVVGTLPAAAWPDSDRIILASVFDDIGGTPAVAHAVISVASADGEVTVEAIPGGSLTGEVWVLFESLSFRISDPEVGS